MIKNNKSYFKVIVLYILLIFNKIPLFALSEIPTINSDAAILIDGTTGQVLYGKNINKKEYPASITKIMTGMLALEHSNLDDIITMTKEGVFSVERNSSHIALDVGEEIPMKSALYAIAVKSANDAANGIGIHISGNLVDFGKLMTRRAKELGALNTNFVTTNGLDDPNHYTTAYDMALIMKQAIITPHFLDFFNVKTYEIPPTNMQKNVRYLHNKNSLLTGRLKYEGLIASKTGWTTNAKHTLVTAAKRGDRVLIVVAMNSDKAQDKYDDTMKLLDYGFDEFDEINLNKYQLIDGLPNNNDLKALTEIIDIKNPKVTSLIHKSITFEDLSFNYKIENSQSTEEKTLKLALKLKNPSEFMYQNIGNYVLGTTIKHTFLPVEESTSIFTKLFKIVRNIILFFIGFAIFKMIVMKYRRYRYQKRKKNQL